jgi:hypothetical protein
VDFSQIPSPVSLSLTGTLHPGFGGVWFNTLHVFPRLTTDLGSVSPGQTIEFEVWNAYEQDYTLDSIDSPEGSGISLLDPPDLPLVFAQLESISFTAVVGSDGPLDVEGAFTFTFGGTTFTVRFFGERAALFTFQPNWENGFSERLQWMTNVIEARDGTEQRIQLRDAPIRTFGFNTLVHGDSLREMNRLLHTRQGRPFAVPLWFDMNALTEFVPAGSTVLNLETTGRDYHSGGSGILWQGPGKYEMFSVDTVGDTSLTLSSATSTDHPRGTMVMPVRMCRMANTIKARRHTSDVSEAELVFQVEELGHSFPGSDGEGYTHRGVTVLTQEPNRLNELEETYSRKLDIVDPGTTLAFYDDLSPTPRLVTAFEWLLRHRPGIQALRQWLQARAGRLRAAWVPSWNVDLILADTLPAGGLALLTVDTRYRSYYALHEGRRDLFILLKNGTIETRRIHEAYLDDSGFEALVMDSPLGYELRPQDVRLICYMGLMRLADDSCSWDWPAPGVAVVKTNFRLLSEVGTPIVDSMGAGGGGSVGGSGGGSTPSSSAPADVEDLVLTSIGASSAAMSWTLPADTDSVEIWERDVTAAGSFGLRETVGAVSSYSPTGLTPENAYEWKVRAINAHGSSGDSNVVGGTTVASGSGLEASGTVAQGEVITITDGASRFGTRTNVKPVYVNLGDALAGNSLGRDTGNYWGAEVELTTAILLGGQSSAIRYDFKPSFQSSFDNLDMPDVNQPFITYIERYYDFDTTQSQYQNSSGDFNIKTNRPHHPGFNPQNNTYINYRGAEGGNCRAAVEYVDGTQSHYYGAGGPPAFQWMSEEFIMKHSTLNNIDGQYRHYRSNTFLNSNNDYQFMTIDDSYPDKFGRMSLDQVSNGCGSGVSNVWGYFGYINIDDEYRGVYIGDNADRSLCTKLVRLPQTAWAAGSVSAQLVHTHVALNGAWVHVRTGLESWVNDTVQINAINEDEPVISSVSGSFEASGTLTVNGSFTAKRNGQMYFIDFEDETLGEQVTSLDQLADSDEPYRAHAVTPKFGSMYARCHAIQNRLKTAGIVLASTQNEIYVESWARLQVPDFTSEFGNAQVKMFRLVPSTSIGENHQGRNPVLTTTYSDTNGLQAQVRPTGEDTSQGDFYGSGFGNYLNTWLRHVYYVKLGSPSVTDGKRYCKLGPINKFTYSSVPAPGHMASINGTVSETEWDGEPILLNDGTLEGLIGTVLMPYYTREDQETISDVDRIYINDSPERVVVGNASTWLACSHDKTYILKQNSRTTSQIVADVDTVTPLEGESAYLYVFNSDGSYNSEGWPL